MNDLGQNYSRKHTNFIGFFLCVFFISIFVDVNKHIHYWLDQAEADLSTAELLITNGKTLHGLFFCHLAVEKMLKAYVVKCSQNIPPRTHNLYILLERTDLQLTEGSLDFMGVLMKYQLEGRYPEFHPVPPTKDEATDILDTAKNIIKWLKERI